MVQHNTIQYDTIRYDMVQHDTIWPIDPVGSFTPSAAYISWFHWRINNSANTNTKCLWCCYWCEGATLTRRHCPIGSCYVSLCLTELFLQPVRSKAKTWYPQRKAFGAVLGSFINATMPWKFWKNCRYYSIYASSSLVRSRFLQLCFVFLSGLLWAHGKRLLPGCVTTKRKLLGSEIQLNFWRLARRTSEISESWILGDPDAVQGYLVVSFNRFNDRYLDFDFKK